MTLITKSEELMAVSVRQGVELAAIEAKVLLGYLEGHDYSLMMDDKFHLTLHDNQDGENADNDQPYTIRDCIDFCQEMNSELLLWRKLEKKAATRTTSASFRRTS